MKQQLQRAFAADGPFAARVPGFRLRAQQLEMSQAIGEAIEATGVLVAEAGTGTGKTFAYLVPALLACGQPDLERLFGGQVIATDESLATLEHRHPGPYRRPWTPTHHSTLRPVTTRRPPARMGAHGRRSHRNHRHPGRRRACLLGHADSRPPHARCGDHPPHARVGSGQHQAVPQRSVLARGTGVTAWVALWARSRCGVPS